MFFECKSTQDGVLVDLARAFDTFSHPDLMDHFRNHWIKMKYTKSNSDLP